MIWAPHIRSRGEADSNANTTADGQGHTLTYDAWNRLIAVTNGTASGGTIVALYSYDGMGRQTTQDDLGVSNLTLYYSARWQVLQMGGERFVWSPVYVDALVLRDDNSFAETLPVQRSYVLQDADYNTTAVVQMQLTAPDGNGDGNVDIFDLNLVSSNWMNHTGDGDAAGDFNHDGVVDQADLDIVIADWREHGLPTPTGWSVVQREVYDAYDNAKFYDALWNSGVNFVNEPQKMTRRPTEKFAGCQALFSANSNEDPQWRSSSKPRPDKSINDIFGQ